MKRLYVFVLKGFFAPFVFTFFICMFVLLMQFLWRYIDDLVGKGLEWIVIMEFMLYISVTLVSMALPLAILLASIMTFGNMGENYELIAMKSAGISLQKIMKPLIILIILISIGAFYFSNIVVPYASLKSTTLLYDIRHQRPELVLKEGIFTNDLPGFSIKVGKINKTNGMMYNMLIYDHQENLGNIKVIVADSGLMNISKDERYMGLTLFSGNLYEDIKQKVRKKTYPSQRIKFGEYKSLVDLPNSELKRTDESVFKNSYRMLNVKQLSEQRDSLEKLLHKKQKKFALKLTNTNLFGKENRFLRTDSLKQKDIIAKSMDADSLYNSLSLKDKLNTINNALSYGRKTKKDISQNSTTFLYEEKRIRRYINEWHRKFTLSFACFIFFFIGAPLGAIIRKGGLGLPVIISVLFFIIYYIISMTGERFAKEGVLLPYQGMWISSVIILPLGIILTYKAATDSAILNTSAYTDFFKKINFFKKNNRT